MTQPEERTRLEQRYISAQRNWNPGWDAILELDPPFLEAILRFSDVPWKRTGCLEPKVKEFIHIAVDSAATHLYEPGMRRHISAALDEGASAAEIMEVIELTSTLGIHACNVGVPLLLETARRRGQEAANSLDARRLQLKQEFSDKRGYWHEFWDGILAQDPDLFEAYTALSSVPWTSGPLEPKIKELIYTAFDASATHLYLPGLRQHIENALEHGATVEEVMEVLAIASTVGLHCATVAAPILVDELRRRNEELNA